MRLHSFRSLASLLIFLRPALDIGGLGCVMVVVSSLGVCMGQILVDMSWYSCACVVLWRCVERSWCVDFERGRAYISNRGV